MSWSESTTGADACSGDAVDRMEADTEGLGLAFYRILQFVMNRWMEVYDFENSRYFFERWRENIRMNMEGDSEPETTFLEYCDTRDIDSP